MFGRRGREGPTGDPAGPAEPADASELGALLSDLCEVVVRTAAGRRRPEDATFLLRTGDDQWHAIAFTDRLATTLVTRLRALPGFDPRLLLELIGGPTARVVRLWLRPAADDRPAPTVPAQREPSEPNTGTTGLPGPAATGRTP